MVDKIQSGSQNLGTELQQMVQLIKETEDHQSRSLGIERRWQLYNPEDKLIVFNIFVLKLQLPDSVNK